MTRAEARILIRKELGETTAAFWTDAELNTWMNLAGHDIAEKALCIKSKSFMTTAEGQKEYDMDSLFAGFICPTKVYMYQDGMTWEEMDQKTLEEMNHEFPGWKSAANGTPYLYIFEQDRGKVMTLYVPPNALNSGTDYVEVYYAKDFSDISADTASLSSQLDSVVLELALTDWVIAMGFETRGQTEKANDRWTKYYGKLQNYKTNLLNRMDEDQDIIMRPYRSR